MVPLSFEFENSPISAITEVILGFCFTPHFLLGFLRGLQETSTISPYANGSNSIPTLWMACPADSKHVAGQES